MRKLKMTDEAKQILFTDTNFKTLAHSYKIYMYLKDQSQVSVL